MATVRSIEHIRWNVVNGISSYEDVKTILGRYEQLMEDLKESDPQLWKHYKQKEKSVE